MGQGYERLELKMPIWLPAAIGGAAVIITVVLLSIALQPGTASTTRSVFLVAIPLYLLGDAAILYFFLNMRVLASASGIEYKHLFQSKSVPWDAIASWEENTPRSGNGSTLQLHDREDRLLLSFPAVIGTPEERKRLREMLDRHCKGSARA